MQWHAGTPELVQRLLRHQLLLPETLLQRSISNLGELTRLENALQKLANGEETLTPHSSSLHYLDKAGLLYLKKLALKSCKSPNSRAVQETQ